MELSDGQVAILPFSLEPIFLSYRVRRRGIFFVIVAGFLSDLGVALPERGQSHV